MAQARPDSILGNTRPGNGALRSNLHFTTRYRGAKHFRQRQRQRRLYWVCSPELNREKPKQTVLTTTRSVVVIILFIGLCLLFDLLSMIWLCRHSLRPKTFLIFQVIETTIWIVLVVLSLVGLAGSRYRRPSPLAYILQIILL